VRRRTLLLAVGLLVLGLISGLSLYGRAKEKDMDSKESVASAAEPKAVEGHFDASPQGRIETATFAMG
jgi:hypothetical protein